MFEMDKRIYADPKSAYYIQSKSGKLVKVHDGYLRDTLSAGHNAVFGDRMDVSVSF